MRGPEMRRQLNRLAESFDEVAIPSDGRYVRASARADENGVRFVPPAVFPTTALLLAVGTGVAVGALTAGSRGPSRATN